MKKSSKALSLPGLCHGRGNAAFRLQAGRFCACCGAPPAGQVSSGGRGGHLGRGEARMYLLGDRTPTLTQCLTDQREAKGKINATSQ